MRLAGPAIAAVGSIPMTAAVAIAIGMLPASPWAASAFLVLGIGTWAAGLIRSVRTRGSAGGIPSPAPLDGADLDPPRLARLIGPLPVPASAPDLPGWRLGETLGQGGMGIVYRGVRHRDGLVAAVKVLHPEVADTPGLRDRLRREAAALARIDHPGVVRCLDGDGATVVPWIAMELVEGTDLRRLLADGPLSAPEAARVIHDLGAALTAVHALGIVHRDLKPDNVLLDERGRVRLTDFGLALDQGALAMTATGAVLGSLHYLAPEQVRGGPVDHRADQYALAVLAYELLTGDLPLGRFPPPSETAEVLPTVDAAILRALARSPDDRWPSVAAFLAAWDRPC